MNKNQPVNSLQNQSLLLLISLIAAGLAGNYCKFSLFLNFDFLFGSIFALLALQVFGLGRGILAGLIISSYTFVIWNHPYAIIVLTAEVAVVGWLSSRRKLGLVLASTLFWLCLGMPLDYLFYHGTMHVPFGNVSIIMVKHALNGIANALVARLLFTVYVLQTRRILLPFRELVFNLLAFFVLSPALLLLGITSRHDFAETDRHMRQALRHDSRQVTDRLASWLQDRTRTIANLTKMAETHTPAQMQPYMEQARAADNNFTRIGLHNTEATAVAYSPLSDEQGQPLMGKEFADRPYIGELKQSLQPKLSEMVITRFGPPKPIAIILAPVISQGAYAGYATGILSLDHIRHILDININNVDMRYVLLDKNGNIIATNRPEQKCMTPFVRGKGSLKRIDNTINQWIPTVPFNIPTFERRDNTSYVAETSIGALAEWRLILEQPTAPIQKILRERYAKVMALVFLILLGSLALAEYVSRRAIGSIEKLNEKSARLPDKIATGAAISWPETSVLEISRLIANFREMAVALGERFRESRQLNENLETVVAARTLELRESEARYRSLFENNHEIMLLINPANGCIVDANPAACNYYGWQREELVCMHIDQINTLTAEEISRKMALALAENPSHFNFRHRRADGSVRDVEVFTGPVQVQGERLLYSFVQDVTERKQAELEIQRLNTYLEQLISERTAELELTNRDLTGFCYAISHELRAPIGRLKGFGKILAEELAIDPAETRYCAERIIVASSQLQQVIDAVLQLSRLSRTTITTESLDLSAMAREVSTELLSSTPDRQREIIIADALSATGDRQLLRICLENLLANALKYTARQPLARVEFGLDAASGAFFVQDNGAGFDMAHAGKLFEPFQRLHSAEEFVGTGIGLATVQRIIERHGGRIWATAAPGNGATFNFTLGGII